MKALLSTALLVLTISTSTQAETHLLHNTGKFKVVKFTDDFTDETTSCQMVIIKDKVSMSIFSSGGARSRMAGNAGNLEASGIKYKVDKKEVFQTGSTYPTSGDAIYPTMPSNLLDDLATGKVMVIEMVPGNQFGDTATAKFKLTDSGVAVEVYRKCVNKIKA